jgi:acetyltransferase-like isoleucine patch superfamily enzyme
MSLGTEARRTQGSWNLWAILGALNLRWHQLKTMLWYRLHFKSIGPKTIIRKPMFIGNPRFISLGTGVFIRDGARLEAVPRAGEASPEVRIGNNVSIEQDFHLACCSRITINDNVSIAARCAVVDITHPYWEVDVGKNLAASVLSGLHGVKIGRRVFLGIGVTILPNVEIGEGAVIGAHSVVMNDIPAFAVATGVPAKVIRFWKKPEDL